MNTRARTRKRASQVCLLLLGAALALAAIDALSTRVDTSDGSPSKSWGRTKHHDRAGEEVQVQEKTKKSETLQRRDFVTLRDIQLVGAAAGLVSPRDEGSPAAVSSPSARDDLPSQTDDVSTEQTMYEESSDLTVPQASLTERPRHQQVAPRRCECGPANTTPAHADIPVRPAAAQIRHLQEPPQRFHVSLHGSEQNCDD